MISRISFVQAAVSAAAERYVLLLLHSGSHTSPLSIDAGGPFEATSAAVSNEYEVLLAIRDSMPYLTDTWSRLGWWLEGMELYGPLPNELIGQLSELNTLLLDNCGLHGTLPDSYSSLTKLVSLGLSGNAIEGSIPSSYGMLGALKTLLLADNRLTGALSDTAWLGNLTRLTQLELSRNAFTGSIPTQWQSLANLQILRLESNIGITGTLPEFFSNFKFLQFL
eukprot:gene13516-13641_t